MDYSEISVPVVRGLSTKEIEQHALEFLMLTAPECLDTPMPVPVLEIFENMLDRFGYTPAIGKNVKGLGGVTDVTNREIELPLASYNRLEKGDPQGRFTAAHEFGHMILHGQSNAVGGKYPSRENVTFARRSQLRAFEDPEWQANTFAAAVLMPYPMMKQLFKTGKMDVQTVIEAFKVSKTAAEIRVKKLTEDFRK
ncbi:ImmA/IrrE family metallo-endopeptidase [Bdellovibrio sp. 22V]|uniref:ImmA/IrrE family metallo-endopeptidase n=1 Tax=Bdellovibrio sp. 22V TaxID=3044166 RepID=UPI002543C6A1|nr:ImmA/IrrE family metallo-endopeptidase [Bdellovibrio sp. 22V]WII72169.1 ImmA/IrrE family metallo-endopeptidase [Bdellovibrio sp. 22V]